MVTPIGRIEEVNMTVVMVVAIVTLAARHPSRTLSQDKDPITTATTRVATTRFQTVTPPATTITISTVKKEAMMGDTIVEAAGIETITVIIEIQTMTATETGETTTITRTIEATIESISPDTGMVLVGTDK